MLGVPRMLRNPCLSNFQQQCHRRKVSSQRQTGGHSYFQGQYNQQGKKEYFYYIDNQGMLFLDDKKIKDFTNCYRNKIFLKFLFSRLKRNDSGYYDEVFPYLSSSNNEQGYIRCQSVPIVFTHILDNSQSKQPLFSFNHAQRFLTVPFQPSKLCMNPDTRCVYHPVRGNSGGIGLVASTLSLEWTKEKRFIFGNNEDKPPTDFVWNSSEISLTNEMLPRILEMEANRK